MSQDQPLINHEMTLFIVEDNVRLKASFYYFYEVSETFIKGVTINHKIIHENFYYMLHKIGKDADHAHLEYG